jgi:hypothetical protein
MNYLGTNCVKEKEDNGKCTVTAEMETRHRDALRLLANMDNTTVNSQINHAVIEYLKKRAYE